MRWWLAALAVSGCIHPTYVRPPVAVQTRWQGAAALNTQPSWPARDWWESFNDGNLSELEQTALAQNYDLQAALSRVKQARATARIAGAALYPAVDLDLRGKRGQRNSKASASGRLNSADLLAVYDPDVWGELRGIKHAAQAEVLAASEASANAALTVAATVASLYFQVAAFDERIELTRETIAAAQRVDGLVEFRYQAGAVSELDRAQARANLANIRAGLPALEQGRQETANALSVLLGKSPADLTVKPPPVTTFTLPPTLPVGLPSQLLQRRPDIRQAEANLVAANADVGAARARLFPSILLTGDGGYASDQLRDLISHSNSTLTVGLNVLAPIFRGGALRANVARSHERYNELLQQYHQSILGALRDVEDALVSLEKLSAQETLLHEAEREARRAFELAELRYRSGAVDALTMLNAENVWLSARNSVVLTRLNRMSALVSLYRALGGGVEG